MKILLNLHLLPSPKPKNHPHNHNYPQQNLIHHKNLINLIHLRMFHYQNQSNRQSSNMCQRRHIMNTDHINPQKLRNRSLSSRQETTKHHTSQNNSSQPSTSQFHTHIKSSKHKNTVFQINCLWMDPKTS